MNREETLRLLRGGERGVRRSLPYLRLADLSGADLSRADLSRVELPEANLVAANLGWAHLDMADLRYVVEVNTIGPIEVSRALLPLLEKGTDAKIVHVTSKMGSIADNHSGGWWAYRISKAALHMACANMAHELRDTGIATMVIHPGWVRTAMGGRTAPLNTEESVVGMIEVIDGLESADSGCFRDYTGAEVPW